WNFSAEQLNVRRHLPSALALILPAQHQHGQTVKREAPDHTECVGFAKDDYVTTAEQDGENLQAHNQIYDAIARAIFLLGLTKPVSEDAVFGDAVENAVGPDDRSIDCTREDQKAHDHDKRAKDQPDYQRTGKIHGQSGDQIVTVNRYTNAVWN